MKVEEMVPMAKTNENAQPLIHVKNLRKSFGDQIVLDGIELEVGQGETMAVLQRPK